MSKSLVVYWELGGWHAESFEREQNVANCTAFCEAYTNLKIVISAGANRVLFIHVRYTWFTMEALEDTWENLQKIIEVCKLTFSDLLISNNNIQFCPYSFLILSNEGKFTSFAL